MHYQWLDEYLLQKRGVTKDLQPVWNWVRYHIGGKMFEAVCLDNAGKPCPLYACAVNRKHRTGCGDAACPLWEQVRDPVLSEEAFRASISARLENWKGVHCDAI